MRCNCTDNTKIIIHQYYLRCGDGWRPFIFKNIETNSTCGADIHMVYFRGEGDGRRLEWVIGRKVNIQKEHTIRKANHLDL